MTFWTNFSYVGYRKEPDIEACRRILLDAGVCTYLEDSETTINGIRIYGSPWYEVIRSMYIYMYMHVCVLYVCMYAYVSVVPWVCGSWLIILL